MDIEMNMATVVTPISTDTARAATLEWTERSENGKQRRRSKALTSAVLVHSRRRFLRGETGSFVESHSP
jgi:hypothetical protein